MSSMFLARSSLFTSAAVSGNEEKESISGGLAQVHLVGKGAVLEVNVRRLFIQPVLAEPVMLWYSSPSLSRVWT